MAKEERFPTIPMCAECQLDCKKQVSKEIYESFQRKEASFHCSRFKKIKKEK